MRFTADSSADTLPPVSGTRPSVNPQNIGAGFIQQTVMGTRMVDTFDDRVTYEAQIDSTVPQAPSRRIGADVPGVGATIARGTLFTQPFEQNPSVTQSEGNHPARSQVDAATQNVGNGGSYSEEQWRPWAGLPVSYQSDAEYAAHTDDMMQNGPSRMVQPTHLDGPIGVLFLTERTIGVPSRVPYMPSSQPTIRPWDTFMGAFPWTGRKSAQRSPVAGQPFNTDDSIHNDMPSPTGAGGPVTMDNVVHVRPMTFRTAPSPWDTGTDGTYVDSGV